MLLNKILAAVVCVVLPCKIAFSEPLEECLKRAAEDFESCKQEAKDVLSEPPTADNYQIRTDYMRKLNVECPTTYRSDMDECLKLHGSANKTMHSESPLKTLVHTVQFLQSQPL